MSSSRSHVRHPLLWVPSLYLAMGIPFNVVMGGTAARMYKSLGYTDGKITVALGSIGVAWSLKPLWAAFLDMYRTKKFFVLTMELLLAGLFAAIASSLPLPGFFQVSIALFWVAAFASSTQDICGDGVYLTAMSKPRQARLAGVQSTFWVLGKVLATGLLIWTADNLRISHGWPQQQMWTFVMGICAAAMVLLAAWHWFALPTGSVANRPESASHVLRDFGLTAVSFFQKRAFWGMIAFVFLFRLGEGLILIEGQLFLQSPVAQGGLGLTAGQVSQIDAVWGTACNIIGGLLGGVLVGRIGLARSLGFLGICLNVPHFTFLYLSHLAAAGHGVDYSVVTTMVCIEKFGYGFGFVGNMIYMMQQLAPGRWTMTHYAFATSLMNLMLVPTNMISGPLAEWLGFSTYFLVVMFASVPSVLAAWKAPFPLAADDERAAAEGTEDEQMKITIDDPTRISASEREVQVIAGRASMFAMLNILVLLVLDAKILGSLQGREPGTGLVQFWLLVASALLKFYLSWRTYALADEAGAVATACGEAVYVRNARASKVVTWLCGAATAIVLVFAGKLVF